MTVIRQFPQPTTQRKLRQFLGLINFYHRFIRDFAKILQPLNVLLAVPSKGEDKHLIWTEQAVSAFNQVKKALAKATLLFHPQPDAPTFLITDTSDVAVCAVLQQLMGALWSPIVYFPRKLHPAETKYSTFDRELLAIYLANKHFRHFLESRIFYLITDHKPLTFVFSTQTKQHSPRQIRHLDFISQFTRYPAYQRCRQHSS